MVSCVTLDENTIQTSSLEPCHEDSDRAYTIQLQESEAGCGLSYLANASHISLHDVKTVISVYLDHPKENKSYILSQSPFDLVIVFFVTAAAYLAGVISIHGTI